MPKVLHIITSLAVGGAQNHLKILVKGLAQNGWQSDVVFFKDPAMQPEFAPLAGSVRHVPLGRTSLPQTLWQLRRLIEEDGYAIIHTHLLKADAMGALAGALTSVPTVSTKHNDERVLLNPAIGAVHGLLSRLNARIVVISRHVGEFMRTRGRVPARKIVHIPYGIELSRQTPPDVPDTNQASPEPRFISIGRLDPQKGYESLLYAVAAVKRHVPDVRLWVVGDTQHGGEDYRASLLALRTELDLTEHVEFLGVRRDVAALLADAHAFVLASRWEGFGLVFLEAMAAAKPVVATRVSAIPEVVAENETGLLVPPDDPDALARALLDLLQDPARARQMGVAGHARLHAHFSAEAMVAKTLALYTACLGRDETSAGAVRGDGHGP